MRRVQINAADQHLLCSARVGHNALIAVVCLSICPSLPDPKSSMEGRSKLKLAGGKPTTRLTVTPFRGRKDKGQCHQAA